MGLSAEDKKKKSDAAPSQMGQLLLQGWTMLGSQCDDCYVPLMRNKQGDEICVVCETNYRKDAQPKPKEEIKFACVQQVRADHPPIRTPKPFQMFD